MLLSTNLFQISEIRANLSVCQRADFVLRKSNSRKRIISRQRFLAWFVEKMIRPILHFKIVKGKFLPPYAARTYSRAINALSSQSETSHSSIA